MEQRGSRRSWTWKCQAWTWLPWHGIVALIRESKLLQNKWSLPVLVSLGLLKEPRLLKAGSTGVLALVTLFSKTPTWAKKRCYKPPSLLLVHLETNPLNVELITTTNAGFQNSSGPTKQSVPPSLFQLLHSSLNHVVRAALLRPCLKAFFSGPLSVHFFCYFLQTLCISLTPLCYCFLDLDILALSLSSSFRCPQ